MTKFRESNLLICLLLFITTFGLYSLNWIKAHSVVLARIDSKRAFIYKIVVFGFVSFSILVILFLTNKLTPIEGQWIVILWKFFSWAYVLTYFASCFAYFYGLNKLTIGNNHQVLTLLFLLMFHIVFICWWQNKHIDHLNAELSKNRTSRGQTRMALT